MKSGFSHKIRSKFSALIAGGILLAVLALGLAATAFLLQSNQDLRQRASEGLYGGVAQDTGKSDGVCLGVGEKCTSGVSHFDNSCPVTETRCGSQSSESMTVKVAVKDGECLGIESGTEQVCESGSGHVDLTCGGRNYRCGEKQAQPSQAPATPSTVPIPSTEQKLKPDGQCLAPGESCVSGNPRFDTSCPVTETRCGAPRATITTIRVDDGYCLDHNQGNIEHVCKSSSGWVDTTCGGRNYRCGTKPTAGDCSTLSCPVGWQKQAETSGVCGCVAPTEVRKTDGEKCNNNTDCKSNNCQAFPGGKFCVAATQTLSKIPEGGICGTTAYNRECERGLTCYKNLCVSAQEIDVVATGDCLGEGQKCQDGSGYSDLSCGGRNIRCGSIDSSICGVVSNNATTCGQIVGCAWYSCSNKCLPQGTSNKEAGCYGGLGLCDRIQCNADGRKIFLHSSDYGDVCGCEAKNQDWGDCSQNSDCVSNNCAQVGLQKFCAPLGKEYPKEIGEQCDELNRCKTGLVCSEGICRSHCENAIGKSCGDLGRVCNAPAQNTYQICKDGIWQTYGANANSNRSTEINFTNCSPERVESLSNVLGDIEKMASIADRPINIDCKQISQEDDSGGCKIGFYALRTAEADSDLIQMHCDQCYSTHNSITQCEQQNLTHEMMHLYANTKNNFEGEIGNGAAELDSYNKVIGCMSLGKGKYRFQHEEPASVYGRTNCAEALAEAARIMVNNPCYLKKNYPIQFKWFTSNEDSPYQGTQIECK